MKKNCTGKATMYMQNKDDALEVFQEIFYKALNSIDSLNNNDYIFQS
ncbi:hypothetical protein ACQKMN_03830 [Ureibacillus composti]